jgi:transposase
MRHATSGQTRMAAFCRRHSYRGGKSPAELLARLRSAPGAPIGLPPATPSAIIGAQVRLLRPLQKVIARHRARHRGPLGHPPRAQRLEQLPGVGTINLAQLLSEVGPILDRVVSAEQAATECGAAPVPKASGKTWSVADVLRDHTVGGHNA